MIKLVNIHKFYEGGDTGFLALKDINLDFKDDKFVCILGKSGSGKTTLLNIIGGLDKASTGHMVINGALTTKFTETQWDYFRNNKIGFIFQNYSLIEHLSVLDNVMLSNKLQGIDVQESKEKALKMLEKVKILDQAKKIPKQLSGGQRQRVAIARALVNDPEIILADEPTGSLDKKTSREILDLLKEISENKLVIMVTHNKKIANKYANRIITLKDGYVYSDTKDETNEKVLIKKVENQSTKFKFIDKVKHAFKNIRMKKWRSFLTALGLAIGVAGFILIDGISNGVKLNVEKQINAFNNRPNLTFTVLNRTLEEKNLDFNGYIDKLLTDEDIKAVRYNKYLFLDTVKLENNELDRNKLSRQELTYKFTDLESEQLRYFGKLFDDGKWPINNNEIVISKSYATSLYDIDNIKTVWEKLKGAKIEVASAYYYVIPYELMIENNSCASYTFIDESTPPTGYNSELYGDYSQQISTQKDIFNKLIYDISDNSKVMFCQSYDPFKVYFSNEIKETKEYTIVGINDSPTINYSIITEEEYMSLQKNSNYLNLYESEGLSQTFDIYLENNAKDDLFDIKLRYKDEAIINEVFDISSVGLPAFNIVVEIIQFIISLIMLISVITAGIMLLMVLFISVIERSREIGILRSLGATKSDILSVFVVESGVLGFFAGLMGSILAIIISIGGNIFINSYYKIEIERMMNETNINIIAIRPLACVIAIIVCILFAMLFGLIPAIRASKKTPIEALKRVNK